MVHSRRPGRSTTSGLPSQAGSSRPTAAKMALASEISPAAKGPRCSSRGFRTVSQVAQHLGQDHFRVSCLKAALYRGLDPALRLGLAHAVAEEIGIATEVLGKSVIPTNGVGIGLAGRVHNAGAGSSYSMRVDHCTHAAVRATGSAAGAGTIPTTARRDQRRLSVFSGRGDPQH
jgi:hypothetical protein